MKKSEHDTEDYIQKKVIVDISSGEVLQEEFLLTLKKEKSFVKMYVGNIGVLLGIPTTDLRILLLLVKHMDINNMVRLVVVCEDRVYDNKHIRNRVQFLIKYNCIFRVGRGKYKVNENLFSRTNYKRRVKPIIKSR